MILLTVALSSSLCESASFLPACCAPEMPLAAASKDEQPAPSSGKKTSASSKLKKGNKAPVGSPLERANSLFSAQLNKYVVDGLVDYPAWKKDMKPLNDYINELSKISKDDYERFSSQEKLVFWINAYNAYTIKLVLDNYPIEGSKTYYPKNSIRQVDGFWEEHSIELAGRKVTLESMEHDILRRDFQEPRTHFAVVCAANGCGKLKSSAYTVAGLNAELDQAVASFLSNPKNVRIDSEKKQIHVSQIFKWFPLDFAREVGLGKRFPPPTDDEIVAAYVIAKAPDAVRQKIKVDDAKSYKVIYHEYDWSLNDSTSPSSTH